MSETSKRVLEELKGIKPGQPGTWDHTAGVLAREVEMLEAAAAAFRDQAEVLGDALAHSRAAVSGLAKRVAELEAQLQRVKESEAAFKRVLKEARATLKHGKTSRLLAAIATFDEGSAQGGG
jgi:ABC-type transporter Mla subunit MlaD